MFSFKAIAKRLRPRNFGEWALYLYVAVCALRPWALGAWLFPNDPPAVHVIYRSPMGDIQYFPIINALAQGNGGENAVWESYGKGVVSFPWASLIYHALGTLFFGSYAGYIVADVVVTLAFFLVLREWCRLFSANDGWAGFLAAIYASGLPAIYINFGQIWGARLPRPFVTDVYFIGGLVVLVWLTWKPERMVHWIPWLALGVLMALNLQGFIYSVPVLGMAAGCIWAYGATRDRKNLPQLMVRGGASLGVMLVLSLPFFYQRIFESADVAGRLGVFPMDRWAIWSNPLWRDAGGTFTPGLVEILMLVLFVFFSRRLGLKSIPSQVLAVLVLFQVGAWMAMPLTATITGKLIQPYHYFMVSGGIQTCLLIAVAAYFAGGPLLRFRGAWVLGASLLVASFWVVAQREIVADRSMGPLRPDIYTPPGSDYHGAFTRLVRELDRDTYRDCPVLATTDQQVYVYWVGFHHGSAFLPDNFATTLTNREVEDRLLWFSREEGLSGNDVARFLNQPAIMAFWLGSDLYQCSSLYQKAPQQDYDPGDLARCMENKVDLGAFSLLLPQSDIRRLQARYVEIQAKPEADKPRLDLIILGKDQRHFPLPAPDASRYTLTYHDDYFQVWKAIKPLP